VTVSLTAVCLEHSYASYMWGWQIIFTNTEFCTDNIDRHQ